MRLTEPTAEHILELMTWFSGEHELKRWSGPGFRFPYTADTFSADLKLDSLASCALLAESSQLVGFGQYYLRLGRCHLGRLVVSPEFRGKGMSGELLHQLSTRGASCLNVASLSLFVLASNAAAIRAYERFGFCVARYPEDIGLEDCLYMVKDAI